MPYTPRFEEVFEGIVIDNVIAIIARDMKTALDHFFPADNYPDFAERTLGNFIRLNFPAVAVEPDKGTSNESDDYVGNELSVILNFAVADPVAPTAIRKAVKYLRTLKSILRNASVADYTANAPANRVFAVTKDFTWDYGIPAKNPNVADEFMMPVSLGLNLKFMER